MKTSIFLHIFYIAILSVSIGCYKENNTSLLEGTFFETEIDTQLTYEYISELNKINVYTEEFNDDISDWWMGNDDGFTAGINQGLYQLYNGHGDNLRWLYGGFAIDPQSDFEFEAFIRISSSGDQDGAGIGIRDTEGNLLNFLLDDSNNAAVYSWNAGKEEFKTLLGWEEKYWIDSFHGTLLTIRKNENKYIFFADKKYIGYSTASNVITPDRITFFFKGSASMEVDFVALNYIH
ncbi:MAG: hypothetical protein WBP41_08060 [Saprospiraceae bacterium]